MSRKTDFINRLGELIKRGGGVLLSKGDPIKKVDENRMNSYSSEERLSLLVASPEELQEFDGRRRNLFTKTIDTIDYKESLMWTTQVLNCLINYLGEDHFTTKDVCSIKNLSKIEKAHVSKIMSILRGIKVSIEQGDIVLNEIDKNDELPLYRIFSKFHSVARQLCQRRNNKGTSRHTLIIEDEYDVQDLLHSLLRLFYDDIRPEEHTPSYAGSSSRMDFLLKNEKLVIEVKTTLTGLTEKQLGEQLIIDIEKYKEHKDCNKIFCFVYDPENTLSNPKGITNDLNTRHKDFAEVIIKPDL